MAPGYAATLRAQSACTLCYILRAKHVSLRTDIRIRAKAYPTRQGRFIACSLAFSPVVSRVESVAARAHVHGRREIFANR